MNQSVDEPFYLIIFARCRGVGVEGGVNHKRAGLPGCSCDFTVYYLVQTLLGVACSSGQPKGQRRVGSSVPEEKTAVIHRWRRRARAV